MCVRDDYDDDGTNLCVMYRGHQERLSTLLNMQTFFSPPLALVAMQIIKTHFILRDTLQFFTLCAV